MIFLSKEVEIMKTKNNKERYVYFIKRVVDNESVWVLDDDGYALSSDDNGHDMLMLWPAREFATACTVDDWRSYQAKELSLEHLMNKLLPDLLSKNIKVGIFMVPSTDNTPVLNSDNLFLDLESECQKYE